MVGGPTNSLPRKSKPKFDIPLPQSIIDAFARHLVSEMRKYYAEEDCEACVKGMPGKGDEKDDSIYQ